MSHLFIHKKAFTLIETLATIAIVAVLVATAIIFIPSYLKFATKTANETTLATLNSALADYRVSGGMTQSHSLTGPNTPAKISAVVSALKTGFTYGNRHNIFINQKTSIDPALASAKGSGSSFYFCGYGRTVAGADNSAYAGIYAEAMAMPVVTLSATPSTGTEPLSSILTWTTTDTNTAELTLDGVSVSTNLSGTYTATDLTAGTHTAILTGTSENGSISQSATITVASGTPTATLSASLTEGAAPLTTVLTWSSTIATSGILTLDGVSVGTGTSGTYTASALAAGAHTAVFTATGPTGLTTSQTVTLTSYALPTATMTASVANGAEPFSPTLTYSSTAAVSGTLTLNGTTVATGTSGTYTASNLTEGTYTAIFTVTNPAGSASKSVTLKSYGAPILTLSATPTTGSELFLLDNLAFTYSRTTSYSLILDGTTLNTLGSIAYSTNTSSLSYYPPSALYLTAGTHTFTISATSTGGSTSQSTTVTVSPGTYGTLTASPYSGVSPLDSTLTWSSVNATSGTLTLDGITVGTGTSGTYAASGLTTGVHTAVLTVSGTYGTSTVTRYITVVNSLTGPYQYFKLSITKRAAGTTSSIQMSEFKFTSGGVDIAWPSGTTISALHPNYAALSAEKVVALVDGSTSTKYCDQGFSGIKTTSSSATTTTAGSSIILFDVGAAGISPDGYDWANGNDTSGYSGRKPVSWTLEGSNDGTHWVLLSTATDKSLVSTNYAWVGPFTIP